MKLLLLFVSIFCINISLLNAQDRSWGVGLRAGAFNQRSNFNSKVNISDPNQDIKNGLYYQAFVNKGFGKKQTWMLEANLGYNAFIYESLQSFPSMQYPLYEYSFDKTNVYSLQLNLRYAFWNIKEIKWKHYAGISVAFHKNILNHYGIFNTHTPDPMVEGRYRITYTLYHNFVGPEYFGKIQLNKKLSVQYLFGYKFSTQILTPMGKDNKRSSYIIYDGPTIHLFNINFGLGYQL